MICKDSYQCAGDCWLNIAGDFDVWEIIAKYCKGTEEEKKLIENIFQGNRKKEDILELYNFTKKEKNVVMDSWY